MQITKMLKVEFDIELMLVWITIAVAILALLYILFDVGYFLRSALHIIYGRIFERNIKMEDQTVIYGFCFTNDLDMVFTHMNSARYVRELDFARFHFYDRTGLYQKIVTDNGTVAQSGYCIRYRRPISLFSLFKVTTRIVDWDDRNVYLEQQFITLSDNFIRAVVLSRQTVSGPDVNEILAELLKDNPSYKPEAPPELQHWKTSLEESSNRLKKKD